MVKKSRAHHADEFGQMPSTGLKGLDPPMIGASTGVMLDGIVERESGVTPPPPPVSVRAVVIGLVVMVLLGVVLVFFLAQSGAKF